MKLSETQPARAARGFHRLAESVERLVKSEVHEWHVMQCLHMASMAEAAAGDHRSAAATIKRLADEQRALLANEHRAYVSACAAAAIEMMKAGDRNGARRMIRAATPWAKLLRPSDRLLELANQVLRTQSRRNKKNHRKPL